MATSFNLRGKLTLTIHAGRALKSTELVGKMDPYAVAHISGNKDEKFKTKVVKGGDENPTFEQAYIFNLEGKEDLLHINLWNSRTLGDDHIGRLDLSLDSLDMSTKPHWYQIKDRTNFTKVNGEISMSIKFEGQGLPLGSLSYETHKAATEGAAAPAAAAAAAPAPAAAASAPAPIAAPQVVQPNAYQQPPPQQQFHSQPPQQQYHSQQPPQQQYQQPPQQQYQQPMVQQQPMYQSQAPVQYQQPMVQQQPMYQQAPVYQQPQVMFQPAPQVVFQAPIAQPVYQQPRVVQVGYPGAAPQIIGYWPNGQPRYAGQ